MFTGKIPMQPAKKINRSPERLAGASMFRRLKTITNINRWRNYSDRRPGNEAENEAGLYWWTVDRMKLDSSSGGGNDR